MRSVQTKSSCYSDIPNRGRSRRWTGARDGACAGAGARAGKGAGAISRSGAGATPAGGVSEGASVVEASLRNYVNYSVILELGGKWQEIAIGD